MLQYGVHTGYECMGLSARVPPEVNCRSSFFVGLPSVLLFLLLVVHWFRWCAGGYLSAHIHTMRYRDTPHQGYVDLLELVGKKDYFVLCSNVDGLFQRAGFDPKRIYNPQGDFAYLQVRLLAFLLLFSAVDSQSAAVSEAVLT